MILPNPDYTLKAKSCVNKYYILLNGKESTEMNADQLRDTLFDIVTSNSTSQFTLNEVEDVVYVRVTKGLRG